VPSLRPTQLSSPRPEEGDDYCSRWPNLRSWSTRNHFPKFNVDVNFPLEILVRCMK
jgi:hypothetical protein